MLRPLSLYPLLGLHSFVLIWGSVRTLLPPLPLHPALIQGLLYILTYGLHVRARANGLFAQGEAAALTWPLTGTYPYLLTYLWPLPPPPLPCFLGFPDRPIKLQIDRTASCYEVKSRRAVGWICRPTPTSFPLYLLLPSPSPSRPGHAHYQGQPHTSS